MSTWYIIETLFSVGGFFLLFLFLFLIIFFFLFFFLGGKGYGVCVLLSDMSIYLTHITSSRQVHAQDDLDDLNGHVGRIRERGGGGGEQSHS